MGSAGISSFQNRIGKALGYPRLSESSQMTPRKQFQCLSLGRWLASGLSRNTLTSFPRLSLCSRGSLVCFVPSGCGLKLLEALGLPAAKHLICDACLGRLVLLISHFLLLPPDGIFTRFVESEDFISNICIVVCGYYLRARDVFKVTGI